MGLCDCRGWLGEPDILGQASRLETFEKQLDAVGLRLNGNLSLALLIFHLVG